MTGIEYWSPNTIFQRYLRGKVPNNQKIVKNNLKINCLASIKTVSVCLVSRFYYSVHCSEVLTDKDLSS